MDFSREDLRVGSSVVSLAEVSMEMRSKIWVAICWA